MKVTKTTQPMMMNNKKKELLEKNGVMVQYQKKDGTWSKEKLVRRFGNETNEQVVKRLTELNNKLYREVK